MLVTRDDPDPVIAAIGRFDDADEAWLAAASQQLAATLPDVVWLDHAAVAAACRHLGAQLTDQYGRAATRGFRYTAVPRGGLIVLGTLAYILDLPHDRLSPPSTGPGRGIDDAPLVIVDDVAISGVRLSGFVTARPEARLVVATLHAHPDLRAAFLARHPRVEAFESASDLHDRAPAILGGQHGAWLERWRGRVGPDSIWIGQAERVVYPWNEPDVTVWNPVTQREEPGWGIVPPGRLLRQRPAASARVATMAPATGRLRPAADVVAGEIEGGIVVGRLGDGSAYRLEGIAADMWRALVCVGRSEEPEERLAAAYAVAATRVASDLADFAAELQGAGLLVEDDA